MEQRSILIRLCSVWMLLFAEGKGIVIAVKMELGSEALCNRWRFHNCRELALPDRVYDRTDIGYVTAQRMAQLCGKEQRDITAYYTDRESEAEMQFPSRVHYTRDTYPWQSICVRFLTHLVPAEFSGGCKFGSRSRGLSCKFSVDWYCMYLCYCSVHTKWCVRKSRAHRFQDPRNLCRQPSGQPGEMWVVRLR